MLDLKKHRLDYGDMLIPPLGYRLTKAVAATYSLDLNTLLSIPVALFLSQTLEGEFETEKVQLLEAIQRCPDVLRIYHQEGKIHVPKKQNRLYGLLEECAVGVLPENAYSSFHPKVWILRYEHEDYVTIYRILVLSRNLTYDRNWDVAAMLEGQVTERTQRKSDSLVSFVKHLTTYRDFHESKKFVRDLAKARLQAPEGFASDFQFHPIGIDGYPNPILEKTARKAICISPFVHAEAITTIRGNVTKEFMLFSCREELDKLAPETFDGVQAYSLSNMIVVGESKEQAEDGLGDHAEQNLHAKLYAYQDAGTEVTWFLGSANATKAAFERNIEFLIELHGDSPQVQLSKLKEQLLGNESKVRVFEPFDPRDDFQEDSKEKKLEKQLRELEFTLLRDMDIRRAEVTISENGSNYDLHLILGLEKVSWVNLEVKVSPFNTDGVTPQPLSANQESSITFANINESNLSQFLRFDIWMGTERQRSFLKKVPVEGMPATRVGKILRSIINNTERFFDYLRFMLTSESDKEIVGAEDGNDKKSSEAASVWELSSPIYEQLLLTASRFPKRLEAIDQVIEHLRDFTNDNQEPSVIPKEFLDFWESFKQLVPNKTQRRRT
jgi:HKD family nuclease